MLNLISHLQSFSSITKIFTYCSEVCPAQLQPNSYEDVYQQTYINFERQINYPTPDIYIKLNVKFVGTALMRTISEDSMCIY